MVDDQWPARPGEVGSAADALIGETRVVFEIHFISPCRANNSDQVTLRKSNAVNAKISPTASNSPMSTYSSALPMLYGVSPHTTVGTPARRYSRASEAPTRMLRTGGAPITVVQLRDSSSMTL